MDQTDFLIIGAGVIGLACAAILSEKFSSATITLLERNDTFGLETSSRNSEVIHAGIYYPQDSLKTILCVQGRPMLYKFCQEKHIPHQQISKIIIARTEDEVKTLLELKEQGEANGVLGLELLGVQKIKKLEPHVKAVAGLYSPYTGIIDSYKLMKRLEEIALRNGVIIGYRHELTGIDDIGNGLFAKYCDPSGKEEIIKSRWLINCAGLNSAQVASLAGINVDEAGYRIYPCKGEYFSISYNKAKLVSRLIYPPPLKELKTLGIHLTKALDGRLRLGPNIHYVNEIDYSVNANRREEFYEVARTYLTFITSPEDLTPEMSGIRPKLQGPGEPFRDFIIAHEADKNIPGLINLIGIESPGLTSCFSIAHYVANLIQQS
ncbi:MAG: NAD(P)/FAD-dependent oxidoreductase [Firmicutes bacterium]|nr:NAD(P)/FAD-dependent oxidoreductase [Bacillota bacterium]